MALPVTMVMEDCMAVTTATKVAKKRPQDVEIEAVWRKYKADMSNKELRNRLVERYLPLVKYNGERIWRDFLTASTWTTSSPPACSA